MKKYLEIYEKLKNEIVSGAISKGEKLPSKRTIAAEMNVSVISAEHALELLVSEGYVESEERRGYFASYREGDFYIASETSPSFYASEAHKTANEGLSFDKLAKTTRFVLTNYGEVLFEKPENKGVLELRTAIKRYLARNKGIVAEEEQIVIGSGAEYLYGLIAELLEGEIFAIETPGYKQIERVYERRKTRYEALYLARNGIPTGLLEKTKASVLHVTPFRSYPTGASADVSKKAEYARWAKKRNGFIIEDDYESEFSLAAGVSETVFSLDKEGRVIYVNTFTKTIARSLRVGYMILPKRLVKAFDEKLGFYTCTVPTLEQYVIATVLNDGTFEKHINKIRRQRRARGNEEK